MARASSREQLMGFLEARAWRPVLEASPGRYAPPLRQALREVQEAVARDRRRAEADPTPAALRAWFTRAMREHETRRLRDRLIALDLPALPDLADEFLELCDALGGCGEA